MNKQQYQELYLLGVLIATTLIATVFGFINNYHFYTQFYLGVISLFISFSLYFLNKKYYPYALGLSLIFAVSGLIYFVPFQVGINIFFIKIQLIPAVFLLFFTYKYRSQIVDLIQNHNAKTDAEKVSEKQRRTEKFKADFRNLSDLEIENRLKYDLTPEARKALLEIKTERNI